ncbi:MAG: DUF3489 domain-containing protein [Magnetococcales bacterium]|nr:DUF3489 domain-containing protein [Magnetococcales bacterium]
MNELTPTQKTILEAAIGHLNGSIHPLPENLKGEAARKVIKCLLKKELIEEDGHEAWRITEAGYRAIGLTLPQDAEVQHNAIDDYEADVVTAEQSVMTETADATTDLATDIPTTVGQADGEPFTTLNVEVDDTLAQLPEETSCLNVSTTAALTLADAEKAYAEADAAYEAAAKAYQDADDALNKTIRKGKSQAIIEQAREEMVAAREAANQTAEAAMTAQTILNSIASQATTDADTTDETPTALPTADKLPKFITIEVSPVMRIAIEAALNTPLAMTIDGEPDPTMETGENFEEDIAAAEQSLAETQTQASTEADERALIALLEIISRRHLSIETLETRLSDSLDFHNIAVWCIRNALIAAYEAGLQAAKKPTIKRTPKASADKAPRDNKKSMVLAMLARPDGATIEQIADATNWQTHTIRSFLSIAKKKGANIEMAGTSTDGSRIYHIAA